MALRSGIIACRKSLWLPPQRPQKCTQRKRKRPKFANNFNELSATIFGLPSTAPQNKAMLPLFCSSTSLLRPCMGAAEVIFAAVEVPCFFWCLNGKAHAHGMILRRRGGKITQTKTQLLRFS